jgi:ribosomal protein S3AE
MLKDTLIEKIWTLFIDVYNLFLADLGVNWESFVRKLIEAQEDLNNQIKNAFECIFSLKKITS